LGQIGVRLLEPQNSWEIENGKMEEWEILKSKSGKLKLDGPSGDAGPI
jgi:hypothetical protein